MTGAAGDRSWVGAPLLPWVGRVSWVAAAAAGGEGGGGALLLLPPAGKEDIERLGSWERGTGMAGP
jgi:hypothetical protein